MKRTHWVVLVAVLLALALFALKLNDKPLAPESRQEPGSRTVVPTAPDAPPSQSLGREDHGIGTTSLPRVPAPLEQP